MTIVSVDLSIPQLNFLAMPNKFRSFVAGYGCMKDNSAILTPQGLRPIAEIGAGDEVVSWNETDQKFQLAPTSGAFPKGKANLYRVITTQGEFVASGHHRIYVGHNNYQRVDELIEHQEIHTSSGNLQQTTGELGRIWSPEDDLYYWQIALNSMGDYEGGHSLYGPLLQKVKDICLRLAPSQVDALKSFQMPLHKDGCQELSTERSRLSLCNDHRRMSRLIHLLGRLDSDAANPTYSLCLGHIYEMFRQCAKSLLRCGGHQINQLFFGLFPHFQEYAFLGSTQNPFSFLPLADLTYESWPERGSCSSRLNRQSPEHFDIHQKDPLFFDVTPNSAYTYVPPDYDLSCYLSIPSIISVERLKVKEWYWDLHVAGNNNYITSDGAIHHNSGKTMVGCVGIGKHFYEFPGVNAGYFAPTYTQIRDIFYPTVEEAFYLMGLRAKVKLGDHEVEVYRGRKAMGKVLCRSMEDPGSIIGFKIGHALADEIDVLKKEKALTAWRKIIARMRYKIDGLRNGIDVTTTPEGFQFVYDEFYSKTLKDKTRATNYGLIQASTYDNEQNLPDDYIQTLLESYPENLISAYINGQFINLKTGTVYSSFSRSLNNCNDVEQEGETLFIGMDFNVGHMAAITHVKREGTPRAVDEIVEGYDTPDMIKKIKERYWRFENGEFFRTRQIRIYPDSSGGSRDSTNASKTDLALLSDAGFIVSAPLSNPPVKDRVNSMNGMFCNAKGERKYKVNIDRCPTYTEDLEQQPWDKNGEPDKKSGKDHRNDAGGYFIHRDYPILRPIISCPIAFTM